MDETPESLRESIVRLSAHSEKLREIAKQNTLEADRIAEIVRGISRRLIEEEERKTKTTGQPQ